MTEEAAKWYLAGMIDGEGSITLLPRNGRTSKQRMIRIASCDRELLETCLEACEVLGISAGIYASHKGGGQYASGKPRKPAWSLVIQKKDSLLKVINNVPVQHEQKREKLEAVRQEIEKFTPVYTEIGVPEENPAIVVEPIRHPVPGREIQPAPVEPEPVAPVTVPEREREPVPA
jgi:hypothetical protein